MEVNEQLVLTCGHPKECYYFHPALKGGNRHRCCLCDDPTGRTQAMKDLVKQGILIEVSPWMGEKFYKGAQ